MDDLSQTRPIHNALIAQDIALEDAATLLASVQKIVASAAFGRIRDEEAIESLIDLFASPLYRNVEVSMPHAVSRYVTGLVWAELRENPKPIPSPRKKARCEALPRKAPPK